MSLLRGLTALEKNLGSDSSTPIVGSQLPITLVPGDLTPYSGKKQKERKEGKEKNCAERGNTQNQGPSCPVQ